jgi:hypothetical protein
MDSHATSDDAWFSYSMGVACPARSVRRHRTRLSSDSAAMRSARVPNCWSSKSKAPMLGTRSHIRAGRPAVSCLSWYTGEVR